MDERDLLFLNPVFKPTIWGGRALATEFGYAIPDGPVGECWVISAHPHGDCTVASGAHAGATLSQLWATRRDLFGGIAGDRFPLLVKVLDAADDLSVQVHPNDAYAAAHEHGSLGKHECWYVLGCHDAAHIAVGQKARDRAELAAWAEQGAWDKIVNEVPIHPGDFFDIAPGTVHAILGGTLILETQQSSDITYRVYDYERRQPDGTLRETHLARALDVIDFSAAPPASGAVTQPEVDGVTHLLASAHFSVDRVRVARRRSLGEDWPFLCVSVVAGEGAVICRGTRHPLAKGSHFVAPSGCGELSFSGELTLVTSRVPA